MARIPRTMVLLHLVEPTGVRPRDAQGQLADLEVPSGLTEPASADAWTGPGRDFVAGSTTGLRAADAADGDTLSIRDVSIQALVSIRDSAASWPRSLYVRGEDGSAAEYYSVGLEVAKLAVPAVPTHYELRLAWMTPAGALKTQLGGTFQAAGDDDVLLLTATRRWVSSTEVVCRYYVGDQLLAEVTSTDGSIAGDTTATSTVGCRKRSGAYGQYWDGVLDELLVTDYEMSPEEVRATWQRLTVHQPAGVALVTGLAPPGLEWGTDRGNATGRLMRVRGEGLGFALAIAEDLRANFLPDRAYQGDIDRWERLIGVAAGPADSLDLRRQRVVAFLSRSNGYAIPQLQAVLADPLDLASSDVEILTFTNRIDDDLTTLAEERWHVDATAGGAWAPDTTDIELTVDAADTIRWGEGGVYEPCRIMTSMSSPAAFIAQAQLVGTSGICDTATLGLYLHNARSLDTLWFGVRNNGGTMELGYRSFKDGVMGAFQVMLTPAPAAPIWLRARQTAVSLPGQYKLAYSTTSAVAGFTEATVGSLLEAPEWAGIGAHAPGAIAGITEHVGEFTLITPNGTRPFCWYAYRDPLLAGAPDMIGANHLLRRLKPAHTHAAAITSKSLLCDDLDDGGCDRGPMGGI